MPIHGVDHFRVLSLDVPFQAAAQQRIDDQLGFVVEKSLVHGGSAAFGGEIGVSGRRISFQRVGRHHRKDRYPDSVSPCQARQGAFANCRGG